MLIVVHHTQCMFQCLCVLGLKKKERKEYEHARTWSTDVSKGIA